MVIGVLARGCEEWDRREMLDWDGDSGGGSGAGTLQMLVQRGVSAADSGRLQLDEWSAVWSCGGIGADQELSFSDGEDGSLQAVIGIDECEEVLEFGGV